MNLEIQKAIHSVDELKVLRDDLIKLRKDVDASTTRNQESQSKATEDKYSVAYNLARVRGNSISHDLGTMLDHFDTLIKTSSGQSPATDEIKTVREISKTWNRMAREVAQPIVGLLDPLLHLFGFSPESDEGKQLWFKVGDKMLEFIRSFDSQE